jgi:hypothetical protein
LALQRQDGDRAGHAAPLPVLPISSVLARRKRQCTHLAASQPRAIAVRYVHEQTGRPILVTEHGLCTDNDAQRAAFIPAVHWTLLDNFEWIFGYKPHYGLCSVDRQTFKRTLKPSAHVLAAIASAVG